MAASVVFENGSKIMSTFAKLQERRVLALNNLNGAEREERFVSLSDCLIARQNQNSSIRAYGHGSKLILERSKGMNVTFDSLVSQLEVISVDDATVTCTGKCGTISVDMCKDVTIKIPSLSSWKSGLLVCASSSNIKVVTCDTSAQEITVPSVEGVKQGIIRVRNDRLTFREVERSNTGYLEEEDVEEEIVV